MNNNFDDSFELYSVRFIIKNSKIKLDKKCEILTRKHFAGHLTKNKKEEELLLSEKAISCLQQCYDVCNQINTCFKSCYNLFCISILFPETEVDKSVIDQIYNTITCRTQNIFDINDLYFLKRLVSSKKKTLEKVKNDKDVPKTKTISERRKQHLKELFEL